MLPFFNREYDRAATAAARSGRSHFSTRATICACYMLDDMRLLLTRLISVSRRDRGAKQLLYFVITPCEYQRLRLPPMVSPAIFFCATLACLFSSRITRQRFLATVLIYDRKLLSSTYVYVRGVGSKRTRAMWIISDSRLVHVVSLTMISRRARYATQIAANTHLCRNV